MNQHREDYSIEKCIDYLNNKYNEEFYYLRPYDDFQPTESTMKLFFGNPKYPDAEILVLASRTNSIKYSDNYLSFVYENRVRDLLKEISEEVYGECKLIYEVNKAVALPDNFGKETTFEEFVSSTRSVISVKLFLKPGYVMTDKKEKLDKVYQLLCNKKVICIYKVYYTASEEQYNSINSSIDITRNKDFLSTGDFFMDDDYSIYIHSWE